MVFGSSLHAWKQFTLILIRIKFQINRRKTKDSFCFTFASLGKWQALYGIIDYFSFLNSEI